MTITRWIRSVIGVRSPSVESIRDQRLSYLKTRVGPSPVSAPDRRSRDGRSGDFRYNAAVIHRAGGVVLLVLLLAAFPAIAALPDQIAAIRLAGLSVLWWYGGAVAPVLAWLIAVVAFPDRSRSRPE
jgi:hypothetical protein